MNRRDKTRRRGQGGRARSRALGAVFLAGLLTAMHPATGSSEPTPASGGPVSFPVCYDFTCRTRETVTLSPVHWDTVLEIFSETPASERDERLLIQRAIGRMEQLVGFHTPTYRDLPRNYSGGGADVSQLPGQMDCVDESINTTTYLRVFEARGLLRFHRVLSRAYRRALLNQHWAGQVEVLDSGERYVIDSWFLENGRQPYIVHSDDWHDISPFRGPRAEPVTEERVSMSTKDR